MKTYKNLFSSFLFHYKDKNPKELGEKEIKKWLLFLIQEKRVSVSHQNQAINAVKFYDEKVLGQEQKTYHLERPKRPNKLPNVMSEQEVIRLIRL